MFATVDTIRMSAVRSLHSTLGLAEMAILQWVLFAESIGVPPSTVHDARVLAQTIEAFGKSHQVADVTEP